MQQIGSGVPLELYSAGLELWVRAVEAYESGVRAYRRAVAARGSTWHTDRLGTSHAGAALDEKRREHEHRPESPRMSETSVSQLSSGIGVDQFALTPREAEIAALIARGLTNQQIAEALVVTPGTAANHVAHILHKLGFRSRTEIAVWALRQLLRVESLSTTATVVDSVAVRRVA